MEPQEIIYRVKEIKILNTEPGKFLEKIWTEDLNVGLMKSLNYKNIWLIY